MRALKTLTLGPTPLYPAEKCLQAIRRVARPEALRVGVVRSQTTPFADSGRATLRSCYRAVTREGPFPA